MSKKFKLLFSTIILIAAFASGAYIITTKDNTSPNNTTNNQTTESLAVQIGRVLVLNSDKLGSDEISFLEYIGNDYIAGVPNIKSPDEVVGNDSSPYWVERRAKYVILHADFKNEKTFVKANSPAAIIFYIYNDSKWTTIHQPTDGIECTKVIEYSIPKTIIDYCLDSTGSFIDNKID